VRTVGRRFTSSQRAAGAPHLPLPRRGEDEEWQEALPFEDLWIGEMIGLELGGVPVLLVNIEGEVRAYLDICPHQRSRLSEGELAGCALTCGTHRWEFDALTGQGLNPSISQLSPLPVRVQEGMIEVMVEAARYGLRDGIEP
jgi:toluene monooxygenase system ferredoxin subunit